MNGESHLTDEEILNYEMESVRRSDDSSSDEYSEDEHVDENGDLF